MTVHFYCDARKRILFKNNTVYHISIMDVDCGIEMEYTLNCKIERGHDHRHRVKRPDT